MAMMDTTVEETVPVVTAPKDLIVAVEDVPKAPSVAEPVEDMTSKAHGMVSDDDERAQEEQAAEVAAPQQVVQEQEQQNFTSHQLHMQENWFNVFHVRPAWQACSQLQAVFDSTKVNQDDHSGKNGEA